MSGEIVSKSNHELDETLEKLTKRLAKGTGIVFSGQILGRFLGFGLQVALGRLLGISGYGLYALAISTLEFSARATQLGLSNGLVRFVAVHRADQNLPRLKGTLLAAFSLGGGASSLGAVGLVLAAPWIAERFFHEPMLVWPLRLAAMALPFYNLVMLAQSGLRGAQRMVYYTAVGLTRQATTFLLAITLVAAGFGVLGAVGGFAAAALLALLLGLQLLGKSVLPRTQGTRPEWHVKELLQFSLPLYLAGFSFLLMSRTDILMLGYFTSPKDVGAYRAAVALARLVVFALMAINITFAPMIADLYHQGALKELALLYKTSARWSMLLSLVVALPLILFPREVLGVYGVEFTQAAWALVTLGAFQVVNAGMGSVEFMLQMSGHQNYVLANSLFSAILNVSLNLWWIPKWGILGASLATGASLAINNLLGMIEVRLLAKIYPFSHDYLRLGWAIAISLIAYSVQETLHLTWKAGLPLTLLSFILGFTTFSMTKVDQLLLKTLEKKFKEIVR